MDRTDIDSSRPIMPGDETRTILVATWGDGLFSVAGGRIHQEIAGRSVRGLTGDGRGNTLAIVDQHSLYRRSFDGQWTELATSEFALSSCVAVGNAVFVGTDDAHVLRHGPDGTLSCLTDFQTISGRDSWYAGTAIVDGKVMGPPLGVRSMTATCDGATLLVNVHVGGIARSTDAGLTWHPTIDVESDVHQVGTHPTRPDIAIAATALGLGISRDAGATWSIERHGLHADHCSAVTFGRNAMFVSAATDPFATEAAVYRRPIEGEGPLRPLGGGAPMWFDGIVDTDCIATRDSMVALIDSSGKLYVSDDDGETWSRRCDGLAGPSGLHIC